MGKEETKEDDLVTSACHVSDDSGAPRARQVHKKEGHGSSCRRGSSRHLAQVL